MRSLIWETAYSIATSGSKRRFFIGSRYIPFQRYLGCYQEAFEVGAVLGYSFRHMLVIFAKLFTEPGREQELTQFMQELAQKKLQEVGKPELLDLAMFAEERRIKTNWLQSGITQAQVAFLEKSHKLQLHKAAEALYVAVSTGIGFGSVFPELTEQLFRARDERVITHGEWAKWQAAGYGDEPPEPITLAKREEHFRSMVESFVREAYPQLIPAFKV